MRERQPIFNVPGPVLALVAVMIAVHAARSLLGEADQLWWLVALAFIPARYAENAAQILPDLPGGEMAAITSFVTHQFVHADNVHLIINGAWLLAFATPLSKRLGVLRFLAFMLCCGIAGALAFMAVHWGLMAPVVGASGAVAGLMGAVMRFLFVAIDAGAGPLLRDDPGAIPLMPLSVALRDRRIVLSTAVFVALNLLAIVGFGLFGGAGSIAWEAHLGGYFFGLLTFGAFDCAAQRSTIPPESPSNVA